jgi:hypothetical protein
VRSLSLRTAPLSSLRSATTKESLTETFNALYSQKWLNESNMKKVLFGLIVIGFILSGSNVFAAYYAQDYAPLYLPYNFQDAVDANYKSCNAVLAQYNSGYLILDKKFESLRKGVAYDGPVWVPMGSQSAFNLDQLRDFTEKEIRLCMIDYRNYQTERNNQAQKEAAQDALNARQSAIAKAVFECNLEFFDTMSNSERIATSDERAACKNKSLSVPIPVSSSSQITVPITQKPITHTQITPKSDKPAVVDTTITPAMATNTVTSTPPQEPVREIKQQEAPQPVTQSEQKPSVFKRVINFLFGWLW